ncbi:MAG: hypothetical protein WBD20_15850 [Pirellulaceae bacterium]
MHSAEEHQDATDTPSRLRPVLIVLFAAILILLCSKSKADDTLLPRPATLLPPSNTEPLARSLNENEEQSLSSPVVLASAVPASDATLTIRVNGETHIIKPATPNHSHPSVVQQTASETQDWVPDAASRPAYLQLSAQLANFDADADPDGWRAEIVLRDSKDRPVVARGQARFELMPRVPTGDFHNYVDANIRPITWTQNVQFDADGVARFQLPLRSPLRPVFGWASAIYPASGLRTMIYDNQSQIHRSGIHSRGSSSRRLGTAIKGDGRNNLGNPAFGELRVKLSIPTEGVFESVTVTPIRPSVLVDTHWPYR